MFCVSCFVLNNILTVIVLFVMPSPGETFPNTVEGFGYAFNKDGQLRKIDPNTGEPGNEPFEFKVSDDPDFNQRRYEALGDVITEHIYGLLEKELGLQKLIVPKDGFPEESSFLFATPDCLANPERLLVLIHGSGVVRAGQWARSLIINDSLKSGSQIPYIKRAVSLGYAVLVMNTNENIRLTEGKVIRYKNSRSAEEHADYVWQHYVKDMNPKHVAIVAHSYGGFTTLELVTQYFSDFCNTVFAIALTDSVHNLKIQKVPTKIRDYLRKVSRNWVTSDTPLDTPVPRSPNDIPSVSAGHIKHEMTSWSSFESVFAFLEERYNSRISGKEEL